MKTFEIEAPDGRLLRQNHTSLAEVTPKLKTGYKVTGEVFGADAKGNGGMVDRFDSQPLMAMLLDGRNGAFLDEWVAKRLMVHAEAGKPAKGKAA